MKWRSIFGEPHRKPSWEYTPNGIIWRILFSNGHRIVGECRNQESKTVSFFCLDEQAGTALWHDLMLETQWWVGIEELHQGSLILHEFTKPDLPEHRGIHVVDLETGTIRWSNKDVTFWFCYQNKLYGYRNLFEKRIAYAFDVGNGEVIATYDKGMDELVPLRQLAMSESAMDEIQFPDRIEIEQAPADVKETLKREGAHRQLFGDVEVMRDDQLLLLSYHLLEEPSTPDAVHLENKFIVIDLSTKKRIYSETLATHAKVVVPDSFFRKDDSLFFVKNQQTLVSIPLWKS